MELWEAAQKGDISGVVRCLAKYEDLNHMNVNHYNRTPLICAAIRGYVEIVKLLVERGADIDLVDDREQTALMYAKDKNYPAIVDLLLEAEVDLSNIDIDTIIRAGNNKHFLSYLSKLRDVNAKDKLGWTVLMRVSMHSHVHPVKMVLDRGADINATEQYGTTALHFAARSGNVEVVEYLLGRGAQINRQNNYGTTGTFCNIHIILQLKPKSNI